MKTLITGQKFKTILDKFRKEYNLKEDQKIDLELFSMFIKKNKLKIKMLDFFAFLKEESKIIKDSSISEVPKAA